MEKKAQARAEEIMSANPKTKKYEALTKAYKELGMTKNKS